MAEREQRAILNDGSAVYHNKDRSLLSPSPQGIENIPVAIKSQNPYSTPVIKTIHTVKTESVPILQKRDIKIQNENGSDSSHDEKQTGDLRKRVESLQIDEANPPPPMDVLRKRGLDIDIDIDIDIGDDSGSRTVKCKTEDIVFEDKEIIFIPKKKPASSSALPQNIPVRTERGMENVSILGFVAGPLENHPNINAGWLDEDDDDDSGLGRGVNASPTVDVDAQYVLPRESAAMPARSGRMNARDYRRALQLRYGRFNFGSSISSSTAGQSSRRQKPHPERERQKGSSGSVSEPSQ